MRDWLALMALAALAGCGGGGGAAAGSTPEENPGEVAFAVAWQAAALALPRDVFAGATPATAQASLSIRAPGAAYWFRYGYDQGLATITHRFRTADEGLDFDIQFNAQKAATAGQHAGELQVEICRDEQCTRPVAGSPFVLPLRLDVGYRAEAEAGLDTWVPAQTTELAHDVVAAAYSAALDAVVMVSARPQAMLRVHDLATGVTRAVSLAGAPTSLAIDAGGLSAAVGHDAEVSLVDLRAGVADPVRRFAVSMPVGPVVLAGARIVAVGAQRNAASPIYGVDTTDGSATLINASAVYSAGDVRLHPAGDRIYLANQLLSPDDVFRLDLTSSFSAAAATDSRYHGEHPFCGRLAVSPDGQRLYTGCGTVLRSDAVLANDMLYDGSLTLSTTAPPQFDTYVAASLSVAPDSASVALLEQRREACDPRYEALSDCHTRVAVHDAATRTRRSLNSLAVHLRGTDRLRQWGRHVMHRADGRLLVIAEVRTAGEATPTWLLHQGSR